MRRVSVRLCGVASNKTSNFIISSSGVFVILINYRRGYAVLNINIPGGKPRRGRRNFIRIRGTVSGKEFRRWNTEIVNSGKCLLVNVHAVRLGRGRDVSVISEDPK